MIPASRVQNQTNELKHTHADGQKTNKKTNTKRKKFEIRAEPT